MPLARLRRFSLVVLAFLLISGVPIHADDATATFPLKDIKPGMKGEVYTIFQGDTIEKVDLVVIGVLENALGPKQDVILVQLLGEKVEHTGVVAGMSGSPVYIDGKLAGALSLKLGVFTKEAIGGVTPIENILHPAAGSNNATPVSAQQLELPNSATARSGLPSGSSLEPIATPLVFSGFQTATLQQFAPQIHE